MTDFAEMGVSIEIDMPASDTPTNDEAFEVMPCNWTSVCAFLACETQWRAVPLMAGGMAAIGTSLIWLGLDYAAVDVVMRRTSVPDAAFADLQIMERAALDAFAEVQA